MGVLSMAEIDLGTVSVEKARSLTGSVNAVPGEAGGTGTPGKDGKDGISATHSWNGTILTITSASGTSSADLKGDKGDTGATGPAGPTGATGPAGPAYELTEADKQEIVEDVLAEMPEIPSGGGTAEWKRIADVSIPEGEEVSEITINTDKDGNALSLDEAVLFYSAKRGASSTTTDGKLDLRLFSDWTFRAGNLAYAENATVVAMKVGPNHLIIDTSYKYNQWGSIEQGDEHIFPTRKYAGGAEPEHLNLKIDQIKFKTNKATETLGIGTVLEVWGR